MSRFCGECGQSITKYKASLTSGIVEALIKFKTAVIEKGENKIHLLQDMRGEFELTRHEWNNFTRLRFHALAVKTDEVGYWLLTKRGNQFLKGEIAIPKWVEVYNNKIVAKSQETVFIGDVFGTIPHFEQHGDFEYADASEDEVEIAKTKIKKSKKRRKNPCPDCDTGVLKTKIEELDTEHPFTKKIVRYKLCIDCGYKEGV